MANVIKTTPLNNSATYRQVLITLVADGTTQETDTIIYDPTTTPYTNSGAYVGTKVRRIKSSASAASAAKVSLIFDGATTSLLWPIAVQNDTDFDFEDLTMVAIPNTATTPTGKIGITTLALAAGDTIAIILDIING